MVDELDARRARLRRRMLDRIEIAEQVLRGRADIQTVRLAAMGCRANAKIILRVLDRAERA